MAYVGETYCSLFRKGRE